LKRRREGKDLNKRKNDCRDSEVAAQLLCTGEFVESLIPQGVYAELRTAHNAYRRLVKERTRITNLVKGLLTELGCFKSYRSAKQMIKMAGSNPTESESAGKKRSRTPNTSGGQGDAVASFGSSFEQTRVHSTVPLPSWPNPYGV
jgi:hypothetical protein